MLRCNTAKGTATVIAEEVSNGGKPTVRVLLDSNGEEKVFLRAFVTESDTPVPAIAKAKPKRKAKPPKAERIPDSLIVGELDEVVTGKYDFSLGQEPTEASTETA